MHASEPLPARLIGALFVERGLVSESQIRVALEIQRETGQQLGQVLVERFGVSRKELASVVAEQWAKLGGSSGPEDSASWRRLGEIFVERGFVTEDELEQALTRQRQTGERLGEALVAQGVISKFELAGALAEQMATLGDPAAEDAPAEQLEATVHHLPMRALDPAEILFGAVVEAEPTVEPELPADDDAEHVAGDVGEIVLEPELVVGDVGEVVFEPGSVVGDVGEVVFEPGSVVGDVGETVLEESVAGDVEEVVLEPETPAEDVGEAAAEPEPADVAEVVRDVVDEPEVVPEPVEVIAIDDVGHVSLVGATTEAVEPEPPEARPTELFDDLRDVISAEVVSADGQQPEPQDSVACLAFAPTTDGYRLVALESLPVPGETVAVPDVGERLVLRVGRSPIPGDHRMCAFVEEPVTPAPVAALAH